MFFMEFQTIRVSIISICLSLGDEGFLSQPLSFSPNFFLKPAFKVSELKYQSLVYLV